jgi:hypothetical protein
VLAELVRTTRRHQWENELTPAARRMTEAAVRM